MGLVWACCRGPWPSSPSPPRSSTLAEPLYLPAPSSSNSNSMSAPPLPGAQFSSASDYTYSASIPPPGAPLGFSFVASSATSEDQNFDYPPLPKLGTRPLARNLDTPDDPSPPPAHIVEYYHSARIAEMIENLKCNPEVDKVESEVEASKVAGWSELSPSEVAGDELASDNLQVFRSIQAQWPGGLFKGWTEGRWEVGAKFAEGGQAELFELWRVDKTGRRVEEVPWVIKMFKEGLRLHDLQKLLPRGMLAHENTQWRGNYDVEQYCNAIKRAMLFNGRFAIMMERKWGDLRKLIDARMVHNNMHGPPFTCKNTGWCMYQIARGMRVLHRWDITHGDLKAANVLVRSSDDIWCRRNLFDPIQGWFTCAVADYECSVGVVGTGFWRAPEILLAAKNGCVSPEMFNQASDVYSYGMTCYEIITGHLPFEVEGFGAKDCDRVIEGCRPCLPSETPNWVKELLGRCWHKDPSKRPTFKDIANVVSQHLIVE